MAAGRSGGPKSALLRLNKEKHCLVRRFSSIKLLSLNKKNLKRKWRGSTTCWTWLQFRGGDKNALVKLGKNVLIKPCFSDIADDIEIEIKKKKKKKRIRIKN